MSDVVTEADATEETPMEIPEALGLENRYTVTDVVYRESDRGIFLDSQGNYWYCGPTTDESCWMSIGPLVGEYGHTFDSNLTADDGVLIVDGEITHVEDDASDPKSGDEMAQELLKDVGDLVHSDRDTHGDAVKNQEHIAAGWTWYLRGIGVLDDDEEITGGDVGRMMGLLKMSRTAVGDYDVDHDRDMAGYAGIAAACEVSRGNADESDLTVNDLGEHE